MKQKVVVSMYQDRFQEQCDELLKTGWVVIPGSVAVSTTDKRGAYVAFFKRPEKANYND